MNPDSACNTCQRKLVKAGAVARCEDWRRTFDTFRKYNLGWSIIDKCSHYVGAIEEKHVALFWGPNYSDSLTHAGIKRCSVNAAVISSSLIAINPKEVIHLPNVINA